MQEKKLICVLVALVVVYAVSALPVDPLGGYDSAPSRSLIESPTLPQTEDIDPILPLLAAVGAVYVLSSLNTVSRPIPQTRLTKEEYLSYLNSEASSGEEIVYVQNPEGEWLPKKASSLKKYFEILDSAEKRLSDLRARLPSSKRHMLRLRMRSETSWETIEAEKRYYMLLNEIKKQENAVNMLKSWSGDLSSFEEVDKGCIKYQNRTYYHYKGIFRGATASEIYSRLKKKALAAEETFRSRLNRIYSSLWASIKSGQTAVDSVLASIQEEYNSLKSSLSSIWKEYLTEQAGRNGEWKRTGKKLADEYIASIGRDAKETLKQYIEKINEFAYDKLTPESVKEEHKILQQKAIEREKLKMRETKRRWSLQLRERAWRASHNLIKEYRDKYNTKIFLEFKKKIDAWYEKAVDSANKMKWQRTLAKAEKRFNEIDDYIKANYKLYDALTHQKAVAKVTEEYNKSINGDKNKQKKKTTKTNKVDSFKQQPKNSVPNLLDPNAPVCSLPIFKPIYRPSIPDTSTSCFIGVDEAKKPVGSDLIRDILGLPSGIWNFATEPIDVGDNIISDISRVLGSNPLTNAALDFFVGIKVHGDGKVTTTRLDMALDLLFIVAPVLRATSWGAKATAFIGRTAVGAIERVLSYKVAAKVGKATALVDDVLKYLISKTSEAKYALEYIKSAFSSIKRLTGLGDDAIRLHLSNLIKLTDDVRGVLSSTHGKIVSQLTDLQANVRKIEQFLETLIKPHGLDEIIGKLDKATSLDKYLAELGKSKNIDLLYGGKNASYTREGIAGLINALINEPFYALMHAANIVVAKIPKPIRSSVSDLLSTFGLSKAEQEKLLSVLKGFDNAGSVRSALNGGEATDAAVSLIEEADETYSDIVGTQNSTLTNFGDLLSQANNTITLDGGSV